MYHIDKIQIGIRENIFYFNLLGSIPSKAAFGMYTLVNKRWHGAFLAYNDRGYETGINPFSAVLHAWKAMQREACII